MMSLQKKFKKILLLTMTWDFCCRDVCRMTGTFTRRIHPTSLSDCFICCVSHPNRFK